MSTFDLRQQLIEIHRTNVGKVEASKNRADWIAPLWTATNANDLYTNLKSAPYYGRPPYCAAGMAWGLREWLRLPDVLAALKMTEAQASKWRCKSAGAFAWGEWAREKGLQFIHTSGVFHTGDIVIYKHSHIEIYVDDTPSGGFTAIGYNTNASGSRDGEGCFEKPRSRTGVKEVFRILP